MPKQDPSDPFWGPGVTLWARLWQQQIDMSLRFWAAWMGQMPHANAADLSREAQKAQPVTRSAQRKAGTKRSAAPGKPGAAPKTAARTTRKAAPEKTAAQPVTRTARTASPTASTPAKAAAKPKAEKPALQPAARPEAATKPAAGTETETRTTTPQRPKASRSDSQTRGTVH